MSALLAAPAAQALTALAAAVISAALTTAMASDLPPGDLPIGDLPPGALDVTDALPAILGADHVSVAMRALFDLPAVRWDAR